MQILEYLDVAGDSPYQDWFESLDAQAAAKVTVALTRIELGNLSNVKGVGAGVQEYRIDFGPGYRIYYTQRGQASSSCCVAAIGLLRTRISPAPLRY